MIKALIFDLDDTLILENDYIYSGFDYLSKYLNEKTGRPNAELLEMLFDSFSIDSTKTFNILYEKLGLEYETDDIKELVDEYRNHKPNISFINDVIPTIQELRNQGYKLGVITDGYKNTQTAKLEVLKASSYFDEIIVTDELGKGFWKPHPKPFEIMREKLNVKFNEMIYVGDNPTKDFYIKNTYPITTIRIKRKKSVYIEEGYLEGIYEDYCISSLRELKKLLRDEIEGE